METASDIDTRSPFQREMDLRSTLARELREMGEWLEDAGLNLTADQKLALLRRLVEISKRTLDQ